MDHESANAARSSLSGLNMATTSSSSKLIRTSRRALIYDGELEAHRCNEVALDTFGPDHASQLWLEDGSLHPPTCHPRPRSCQQSRPRLAKQAKSRSKYHHVRYDASSRMLTAVSGRYSNTVTYTYDSAGRRSTEALTISGQTYTTTVEYDLAGRQAKLTYPDGGEVERGYTARGQLHTLALDSTTIDTRGYDDGGRMTSSSYNNGVSESRTYNADNTLAGISHTGAAIGDLTYGWDANKNKTSESIGGVMSDYGFSVGSSGYDDEDRLVNWERSDSGLDQS